MTRDQWPVARPVIFAEVNFHKKMESNETSKVFIQKQKSTCELTHMGSLREYSALVVVWIISSVHFISVAQSGPTLCNPMNCSTLGLPVHLQLPEFTQTHVHHVGDAIQPSHPLSSPSPPAPNPSQHRGFFLMSQLFTWGGQSTGVSALASFLPKNTQDWSPLEWTILQLKTKRRRKRKKKTNLF